MNMPVDTKHRFLDYEDLPSKAKHELTQVALKNHTNAISLYKALCKGMIPPCGLSSDEERKLRAIRRIGDRNHVLHPKDSSTDRFAERMMDSSKGGIPIRRVGVDTTNNSDTDMSDTDDSTPDRDLPDEQVKTTEDDEDVDSLTPYDEAAQLSQEFARIDNKTISDDRVLADVKGIYMASNGGSIAVEVDLPAEDGTDVFNFTKPKVWTETYDFVRWVTYYDYGSSNFEVMIEDDVEVEVVENGDEYELFIPQSRLGSLKNSLSFSPSSWGLDEPTTMNLLWLFGLPLVIGVLTFLLTGGMVQHEHIEITKAGLPADEQPAIHGNQMFYSTFMAVTVFAVNMGIVVYNSEEYF